MAEPTLVDSGSSDYSDLTTSGEVTKSFTWQNGDVFHILGATEDNAQTLGVPATGGANLTFSQITATNTASNTKCYYWRGTATGSGSGTITATAGGGTNSRGITVWQYRDTSGQGTPQTIVGSSAKTISVTRAQANSHILEVMGDWNEVGDTVTDPTPAGGTQLIELAVSGRVDYFVTQWGDQGATGTTAYGITNHTGTVKMTGIAVEIQGIASGGTTTTKTMTETIPVTDQTLDIATYVRNSADLIVVSDQSVSGAKRGVTASENLALSDAFVNWARRVRLGSDTVELTDGFVSWRRLARLGQDNLDLLDGSSRSVIGSGTVYGRVLSDTLTLTDGFVSWRRLVRVLTENADLLDGFSKTLIGVGIVYARVMSDTTTLIDDTGQHWTLRSARLTEAVGLSDTVIRALARIRILGENIEFSDGAIRFLRAVRVPTETIDLSDELVRAYFPDQIFTVALVFGATDPFRMSTYDPFRFWAADPGLRYGGH